jgi:glutamyl-tRNA synthetase
MSEKVRVRFAPSPTGPLHIGGVRTALFNYLFAKTWNFFLRIEDTDQNRFVTGAESYILEALEWLGIAPDETIGKTKIWSHRQSERKHIYAAYAEELIKNGWAYYAFDSSEALEQARKEQEGNNIYNHTNRELLDTSLLLSKEETESRITNGQSYVIRFKNTRKRNFTFTRYDSW